MNEQTDQPITDPQEAVGSDQDSRYGLLISATRLFNSSLELEEVLDLILGRALELLEAQGGSLWLYRPDEEEAECVYCFGPDNISIVGFRIPVNQGIIGHCMTHHESIIVEDVPTSPWFDGRADQESGFNTRSLICVPLINRDKMIGAIQILNKRDLQKCFSLADLVLLEAISTPAALAIDNARLFAEVADRERMRKELEISSAIQTSIIPHGSPRVQGCELAARTIPALELGGDYYDWSELEDGSLSMLVADVSGKGVPAAIYMAISRSIIWTLMNFSRNPTEIMETANRFLRKSSSSGMFVTLFYARWDPVSGILQYISAGHNPALLLRGTGGSLCLKTRGRPLGALPDPALEMSEWKVEPGDLLVAYTDGAIEALNPDGEEFGEERFIATIESLKDREPLEVIDGLTNALEEFRGPTPVYDDITILAARFEPDSQPAAGSNPAMYRLMQSRSITQVEPVISDVPRVLDFIENGASHSTLSRQEVGELLVAAEEAVVNIIHYAYREQPPRPFQVGYGRLPKGFMVFIEDDGFPFDPTRQPAPLPDRSIEERAKGGFGLVLVRHLVDRVDYAYVRGRGNMLNLLKYHQQ